MIDLSKLGIRKAPWSWKVNESSRSISLHSHGNGGYKVMDFTRWGMQDAQPRFCEPDGIMHDAKELAVEIEGQEHNSSWNKTLKNNEAQLIASAPEILKSLIGLIDFIEDTYPDIVDCTISEDDYKAIQKATGKSWEEIKELIK